MNDKGEKVGNPFKSSLFGKAADIETLERRTALSAKINRDKELKERSKTVVLNAMRTANNRKNFEKTLAKQSISVLFRTNEVYSINKKNENQFHHHTCSPFS